jgi:DNA-binding response OmpR family regulator
MTSLLIVDDDDDLLDIMTVYCKDVGFDTTAVTSAEEALEWLGRKSFDVIAADLNLPGINGLDLYHRLDEKDLMTRYVLMTGSEKKADELKVFDLSIDKVLFKPFNVKHFVSLVQEQLKRRESFLQESKHTPLTVA